MLLFIWREETGQNLDKFISASQVAKILGVSRQRVAKHYKKTLTQFREKINSGRVQYSREEVETLKAKIDRRNLFFVNQAEYARINGVPVSTINGMIIDGRLKIEKEFGRNWIRKGTPVPDLNQKGRPVL